MKRLVPLAFLFVSCGKPQPVKNPTTLPQGRAEPHLPGGPEIADQTMGFVVLRDGARVAGELSSGGDPSQELSKTLGLDPAVTHVVDLRRPIAVAMLNPGLLSTETVRPYVAMLPIRSKEAVVKLLAARGEVVPTPWGIEWKTPAGRIYVAWDRDYAVVAWRKDLLAPAVKLLRPRLAERSEAPLRVHLDLVNLYSAYKPQIGALVTRFVVAAAHGGAGNDPQLGYGLRAIKSLAPYLESFSALDLYADLDSGGLTLSVGVDGKPGGAWAEYVHQQRPGPAWGVRFLPKDAVLAYTTTASPMTRAADQEALLEYMQNLSSGDQGRWKVALDRALGAMQGELAYAVWPARGGGVGMGGAYRLSDPGGAREAINNAYIELAGPLASMVLRGLSLDPARFSRRVHVIRKQAQVGSVEADLMEVSVKWPAGTEAQRRTFEAMFGPKLVMATAFVGDEALFAVGADWAERLSVMIKVAQGEGAASLGDEPEFVEALSYRDQHRVSLTYLDTARMAKFAAYLMSQTRDLAPAEQATVATLLNEVGRGAIVSTTNAHGARYQLTTHLPAGAVAGAAQLHGALWRIALSPLLNPPTMPPIPVPPPHVSPGAPQTGTKM